MTVPEQGLLRNGKQYRFLLEKMMHLRRMITWLTLYAIAMAQVEAALVVYLRHIYYPDNPLSLFPLSLLSSQDLTIELTRELATIIMILSIAILTVKGTTRVFAAFVYVFGVWDIFYYLWLKIMIGWPRTWLEWDILFLIPWPWLAPWITPVLIALLFVVWGGWVLLNENDIRFNRKSLAVFTIGAMLCLLSFLLPAMPLLKEGDAAFRNFQPDTFPWYLYSTGYLLILVSLFYVVSKKRR